jgi:DNA-binding response OmpR family regulator
VSTTVLLAADETGIRGLLEQQLRDHGFEIAAPGGRADLVIAADMPAADGDELERLCAEAPVIVLGAADDRVDDRVRAFRRGCDDYVTRPFDHEELVERIRAVLRRSRRLHPPGAEPLDEARPRIIVAGALEIDENSRRVTLSGVPLSLPHKEFELLAVLAAEPARLFTKAELLRDIWAWPETMRTRTLDSHASRLRRKLRALDPATAYIDNQWGVGYRLVGVSQ